MRDEHCARTALALVTHTYEILRQLARQPGLTVHTYEAIQNVRSKANDFRYVVEF